MMFKRVRCKKCGIYLDEGDDPICDFCKEHDEFFFIPDVESLINLDYKHVKGLKDCPNCEEVMFFRNVDGDIKFPIVHEGCGGLIHVDEGGYSDNYESYTNFDFKCDKCGIVGEIGTEGEYIDDDFKEIFGFKPKKEVNVK